MCEVFLVISRNHVRAVSCSSRHQARHGCPCSALLFFLFVITLDTGPRRPLNLELSDTQGCARCIRAHLGYPGVDARQLQKSISWMSGVIHASDFRTWSTNSVLHLLNCFLQSLCVKSRVVQMAASSVTRLPAPVRRNAIADDALLSGQEALDSGPRTSPPG